MATKKFRCTVCGYVHEGDKAPEACPVCKAPASKFEEIIEPAGDSEAVKPKKKGLNTNSNVYTLIYAAIMVVIVAFLLAFISSALKTKQGVNVALDKKKQILAALNLRDATDVQQSYDKYIVKDMVINAAGDVVKDGAGKDKDGFKIESKDITESALPVFLCNVNGETKYVFPVYGAGLWGPIWGYVALNADKNTVYGVYFSHASETPGLGAEITNYEKFQKPFAGKEVLNNGTVALGVEKNGKVENPAYQIDGIAGATITSKGVDMMLKTCLGHYTKFLTTK